MLQKQLIRKKEFGQVKIGSEVWTAKANIEIPEGTEVIVKEIDGVKVIVEPVEELILK